MVKTTIVNDPAWRELLAKGVKDKTLINLPGRIEENGTKIVYGGGTGILSYVDGEWKNAEREVDEVRWFDEEHNKKSLGVLEIYQNILKKN
jgi:hypothetical protein